MESNKVEDYKSINCLPNEVIALILQHNSITEIMNFGFTCKRFYMLINTTQSIWKCKYKDKMPNDLYKDKEKHHTVDWLSSLKDFYLIKQKLHAALIAMSPNCYWEDRNITLQHVNHIIDIALSNNYNYYQTIYILQDLIAKGNMLLENYERKKPYTLTEMHYSQVALRHLIHVFLAAKWVKERSTNELQPENVANFFLQWVDTAEMHSEKSVEVAIQCLVRNVQLILNSNTSRSPKELRDKYIFAAISDVIFRQPNITIKTGTTVETLIIPKVVQLKMGNLISIAIIYQAVAKRCGIHCDLIAFPNHFFLEYRDKNNRAYTVGLETGTLQERRQCPYSQYTNPNTPRYCPESLLLYIYSSFIRTMTGVENRHTTNALLLSDFITASQSNRNPYKHFISYLQTNIQLKNITTKIDINYLDNEYIQILRETATLNGPLEPLRKKVVVHEHDGSVKFAVGMVCYHKKFHYMCVIRGWDVTCNEVTRNQPLHDTLKYGHDQPYYHVIVANQTERYVAQEHLKEMVYPERMFNLEEILAPEFTHFNGFSYIPNDEKQVEYPGDINIIKVYHERFATSWTPWNLKCKLRT